MEPVPVTRRVRRTVRVAVALVVGQALLCALIGWMMLGPSPLPSRPASVPVAGPPVRKPMPTEENRFVLPPAPPARIATSQPPRLPSPPPASPSRQPAPPSATRPQSPASSVVDTPTVTTAPPALASSPSPSVPAGLAPSAPVVGSSSPSSPCPDCGWRRPGGTWCPDCRWRDPPDRWPYCTRCGWRDPDVRR